MKAYITRISYCLPDTVEENESGRLTRKTGIQRRHICPPDRTAGDMAAEAAEKLFAQAPSERENVAFLLLCTQSPDYPLPTTACILQDRLGLRKSCGALDFNLGCSGFIYGLGLAKGLIESEQAKSVLLLTSETYSKYIHAQDGATRPLFGDGASAALLTGIETPQDGIYGLVYGTDGSGAGELIVPIGGMRHRYQDTEVEKTEDKYGNARTNQNLYMNGSNIMNFALDVVPPALEEVLSKAMLTRKDIDGYVFHQANRVVLDFLQEKCGLMDADFWNDVAEYGNTVSSSIPIALVDRMRRNPEAGQKRVLLMGFGVGLSWGGCVVDLSRVKGAD
ncbi:MAG: ketoacyl-ACP synthase III [Synergistaceae bacterium]|nr:ketoacyl-ACP synthase III [Synergistaceae bacterium]